ncbi:hypothetical protein ACLOJK_016624 [Asimina triloba]
MESSASGEGEPGMDLTVIETAADVLPKSAVFHLIKEIIGFVLYMHHQIPAYSLSPQILILLIKFTAIFIATYGVCDSVLMENAFDVWNGMCGEPTRDVEFTGLAVRIREVLIRFASNLELIKTPRMRSSIVACCINDAVSLRATCCFVGHLGEQSKELKKRKKLILQQLEDEFDMLHNERKDLESILIKSELDATSRRKHNARTREVKQGIRRMEKLMNSISTMVSALQLALSEVPSIESVTLALGGSLSRPQYAYELLFTHITVASESESDWTKSRAAAALSRKVLLFAAAIRALVSNGAGAGSYAGPVKLFLLVKAPATFNLPQHFLPKRDFRYSKKTKPFRLLMKCRRQNGCMDESCHNSRTADSTMSNPASDEMIWSVSMSTCNQGIGFKNPSGRRVKVLALIFNFGSYTSILSWQYSHCGDDRQTMSKFLDMIHAQ